MKLPKNFTEDDFRKAVLGDSDSKLARYIRYTFFKAMDDSNAYALLSMYKDNPKAVDKAVKYPCSYFKQSHKMGLLFLSQLGREHQLMEWHSIVYKRLEQLASVDVKSVVEVPKVKVEVMVQGIRLDVLKTTKIEYEKWFRAETDQLHQIADTRQKEERRVML